LPVVEISKKINCFVRKGLSMPLLAWIDEYSIGNKEIDGQHKELFKIFNRLYDTLSCENSDIDVHLTLDLLIEYAGFHFDAEQKYMRSIDYKDIESHIEEHVYFTNEVLRLIQSRDKSTVDLTKETVLFLCKWLLRHVTEVDNKITARR
jgi:hemerythrin